MKFRRDFVTNSSSSSFILAFTSKETVTEELFDMFKNCSMEDFRVVYNDVQDADKLTQKQVVDMITNYYSDILGWRMYWDYRNKCAREGTDFMSEEYWLERPETKQRVDEQLKKMIQDAKNKMNGKHFIVEVEYSDHDHASLEQDILPYTNNTVFTFNNH